MTSTPPLLPRRGRAGTGRKAVGRLAAIALGASLLVVPVGVHPTPVAAAETGDGGPAVVPGKGTMDADEIPIGLVPRGSGGVARAAESLPLPTGWSGSFALLPGTQMVALSWDGTRSGLTGPDSARLALRSRSADGAWTAWLDIVPDPDDQGGEGAGRVGSEVIWLGSDGADALEVRVDAGPVAGLELLRMRYNEGSPEAAPAPQGTARTAARPTIRSRSDWASGGWKSSNSGCGSGPQVASGLRHAVVHHTASTNSYTQAQVPGLIDGIYRYHTGSLGWCDIAYNFIVDKYGGIWQGRSGDVTKPVVGGHAMGFNTGSVGVSLLGQFEPGATPTSAAPTTAMIDATARVIAWKLSLHGLNPRGTVTVTSGGSTRYSAGTRVTLPVINAHQQSSTTACPGANVLAKMGTIRDLVVQHMDGGAPVQPPPSGPSDPDPSRWDPFSDVQTLTYRQYVDFLRNPGTYEGRSWWNANLANGGTNRNALVVALLESSELQRSTAAPVRLYLAYFDRAPDHGGLRYWWGRMDAGASIRKVSASFAASPEFRSRYGSLSDADFVRLVYRNVLKREPDAEGRAYWLDRLRTGKENRGGVMALFSEAPENKAKTRDRVEAVVTNDVMLQRALTTQGMQDWSLFIKNNRAALINVIFESREYAGRFS